jgi:hypothetical protein
MHKSLDNARRGDVLVAAPRSVPADGGACVIGALIAETCSS